MASILDVYLYKSDPMDFCMKKRVLVAWAAVIGLMSCASQNTFQKDPPFSISQARAQDWAAGREEGGTGTTVSMRWNPYEPGAYTPDTLYFRGRALLPKVEDTETGMQLLASYKRMSGAKNDMIMSGDSLQEVGNQPPRPLEGMDPVPFKLKGDEAVLVYSRVSDKKRFYYKIKGIKQVQGRAYPSRPKN